LTDDEGNLLTAPAPLDGKGAKLAKGKDPVFLQFEIYKSTNFEQLPFNIRNLNKP